ncbi:MAG: FkbM family methyltransferase [Bacteroidia bacterium]
MISRILFSIRQRIFWSGVRKRQAEWKAMPQDGRSIETILPQGIRISLETGNELSAAIYCGSFEWAEREWLNNALKPGNVFFDIGANIGLMSLLAAQKTGATGAVVAFEPVSGTFGKLQKNSALNPQLKNIQTVRAAVSDANGKQEIFITGPGRDAWNSLVPAEGMQSEIIETFRLDDLMNDEKLELPRPDLIKIDVEGWEIHVLRGAEETLKTNKPVLLIEFTASNLEAAGASCAQLASELTRLGYSIHEYEPIKRKLNPVSDFGFEHKNLIALPV